ncbi:hypothetical protein SDC9_46951 [bioreactor metagenome]|uniref:Uncharacterized protein n=1 Tax=bioreactor metagenome TaxID=1076179 RepID=A0A644WB70_9ZZZZ
MGKGDIKTKKGKIFNKSYGKSRPRKKRRKAVEYKQLDYSIEDIYSHVGIYDKVVCINFKRESDAYKKYGSYIIGVFVYTQREREALDKKIKNKQKSFGVIKVEYIGNELSQQLVDELRNEGVNSTEISSIYCTRDKKTNTFHSQVTRVVNPINIQMDKEPNGGDYDWIYGFNKSLISQGIGFSPEEYDFYLALKLFYEPDSLSKEENEYILNDGILKESIEYKHLRIKYYKKNIDKKGFERYITLEHKRKKHLHGVFNHFLIQSGSSIKKILSTNPDQAAVIFDKIVQFQETRLNSDGKIPIYLNLDRYLHVYMRHVKEMKINDQFKNKDNFQWVEDNISFVMGSIINRINDEIQAHFETNPNTRFSKYGEESLYFEGDYYTIHIEPNGCISTFHKNSKV